MKIGIAIILQLLIVVYCKHCEGSDEIPGNTAEIIRKAGYIAESHDVTTDDGYVLKLYRIRGPKGSTPIFLQHCVFASSDTWVISGKNSFAFVLKDMGYDVWMGNYRGNRYSNNHIRITAEDKEFWDFSIDELALYDLPAMINHVTATTGKKLIYVGYSMGSTGFLMMAPEKPEVASKISVAFQLGPVGYIKHTLNPIVKMVAVPALQFILNSPKVTAGVLEKSVHGQKVSVKSWASFLIMQCDKKNFNKTQMPAIEKEVSGGTSAKTLTHVTQQLNVDELHKFDYGSKKNLMIYNQTKPPMYDLTKNKIPAVIIYSKGDGLTTEEDMKRLMSKLTIHEKRVIEDKNFCHMDFFWGKDAPEYVNEPFARILKDFEESNTN